MMRIQFKKKSLEGGEFGSQCYGQWIVGLYEVTCDLESATEIIKILKEGLHILHIKTFAVFWMLYAFFRWGGGESPASEFYMPVFHVSEHTVPWRWHIKFRCWGIAQKKELNRVSQRRRMNTMLKSNQEVESHIRKSQHGRHKSGWKFPEINYNNEKSLSRYR